MTELRRDPIMGRWVIVATARGKRPIPDVKFEPVVADEPSTCPFCPGNESYTPPEILAYRPPETKKDTKGWWLRVIPNKFPVLGIEGQLMRVGDGIYDKMSGIGAHEVIIETPEHTKEIPDLPEKQVEEIFWSFRDRILDLKKDVRFEYILIFKNRGKVAGATLSHPHSQLIALPVVPLRVKQEMSGAKNYYEYKERCVICDMVLQEINAHVRLVAENDDFIAIAPYASRFPFETWVLPKKHDSHFEDATKHEISNLAKIMKVVLYKLKKVLNDPPYNYLIHNSPVKEPHSPYYHWHIEIIPKLGIIAGFEWGTGFYINPVEPEEAAKALQKVI
jgi:UDPglucose--hexose-1-phosphate uridylyltransferase